MNKKYFEIIKINSPSSFLINGGFNEGVNVGEKFLIQDKKSTDIPKTKGKLVVTQVFVGSALLETEKVNLSTPADSSSTPFHLVVAPSLSVNQSEISGELQKSTKPISIGDYAVPTV